jgi:hypothetical protein
MRFWVGFVFVVMLAGAMGGAGLMLIPNLIRCDQNWVCALEKTADAIIGSSNTQEEPGVVPIAAGCLSEADARGLLAAGLFTSSLVSSASEAAARAEAAYQEMSEASECVSVSNAISFLCAQLGHIGSIGSETSSVCLSFVSD